jgi:hypothetical protein
MMNHEMEHISVKEFLNYRIQTLLVLTMEDICKRDNKTCMIW